MTPKGHRVIRGRCDLLYDPKGHSNLCGRFDLIHNSKLGQTDHKGYCDLWGHKVGHGHLKFYSALVWRISLHVPQTWIND